MPVVIARGGSVRVVAVEGGVVTIEASGSPGAVLPAASGIEALLQAAVPEVTHVNVVWPGMHAVDAGPGDLAERVQRILDAEVNPAVAAHGGSVGLVDVAGGRVRLRLEGGCQGCALAEVTIRQGIEVLLRRHVPEIVAVVDVTDHQAGTRPFYAPGKR